MTEVEKRHKIPVPHRMKHLPRNKVGYVVPWFVAKVEGEWDFRVMDGEKLWDSMRFRKCWLCGDVMGKFITYVSGPMCGVNRISAEPPSHHECAVYAAMVCPFLTTPKMVRRSTGIEDGIVPAGVSITRNPGVTMLWTCTEFSAFQAGQGYLFNLNDPSKVEWFAEGRLATREEVLTSVETGLPALQEVASEEGEDAMAELERLRLEFLPLVPSR